MVTSGCIAWIVRRSGADGGGGVACGVCGVQCQLGGGQGRRAIKEAAGRAGGVAARA